LVSDSANLAKLPELLRRGTKKFDVAAASRRATNAQVL
jgi:hypothetical protein